MTGAYISGFIKTAVAHGVNPAYLLKTAYGISPWAGAVPPQNVVFPDGEIYDYNPLRGTAGRMGVAYAKPRYVSPEVIRHSVERDASANKDIHAIMMRRGSLDPRFWGAYTNAVREATDPVHRQLMAADKLSPGGYDFDIRNKTLPASTVDDINARFRQSMFNSTNTVGTAASVSKGAH